MADSGELINSARSARNDLARVARLLTEAERIARSITSGWVLSGIAEVLAASDPGRAERIARSITDDFWQAWALSRIAEALAATDPDRAAGLFTDEYVEAWALCDITEALADTDNARRFGPAT